VAHALVAVWVASRNSVTFDENFHVPAGVRILRAADFASSYAQPPLPKTLYGLAAIAAGARPPDPRVASPGAERFVGYSFMRENADRYARVYFAARLVAVLLSAGLGVLVWRAARAWGGSAAGLLALLLWVALPETLAHAAIAGVDLPTGLAFFGATLAWLGFARTGAWRRWIPAALWTGAAFLTRFSAVQLFAIFAALAALVPAPRGRRRAVWIGLALLPLVAVLALDSGYLFQVSLRPLGELELHSPAMLGLAHRLPALRVPLPDAWISGVDYLGFLAQPGSKASFVLGQVTRQHVWWYFPLAIAVKWPLGLLGLLALAAFTAARRAPTRRAWRRDAALLVPAAVVLLSSMASNLDYGVRYVFPMLPFLCVWIATSLARPAVGVSAAARAGAPARRTVIAVATAFAALVVLESVGALPYPLAFFNRLAGGPGGGDRIVNDSNVDWGQGLIALRADMKRLGISRVRLAYHGTTDPAVYGIDYDVYLGEAPAPGDRWLAVSSYFLVGLPARLTSTRGMSEQPVAFDFGALRPLTPVARPAHCMYLYRLP
jgi:hypothetical protein